MAAALKQELGIETDLVVGDSGEFTIWVDGKKVAEKKWMTFPDPKDVVGSVRAALAALPS